MPSLPVDSDSTGQCFHSNHNTNMGGDVTNTGGLEVDLATGFGVTDLIKRCFRNSGDIRDYYTLKNVPTIFLQPFHTSIESIDSKQQTWRESDIALNNSDCSEVAPVPTSTTVAHASRTHQHQAGLITNGSSSGSRAVMCSMDLLNEVDEPDGSVSVESSWTHRLDASIHSLVSSCSHIWKSVLAKSSRHSKLSSNNVHNADNSSNIDNRLLRSSFSDTFRAGSVDAKHVGNEYSTSATGEPSLAADKSRVLTSLPQLPVVTAAPSIYTNSVTSNRPDNPFILPDSKAVGVVYVCEEAVDGDRVTTCDSDAASSGS